jgi:hypothetical protein
MLHAIGPGRQNHVPRQSVFGYLLAILLCLRTANRPLYLKYYNGEATPEELMQYIRSLAGGNTFADSDLGIQTEAHLLNGVRNENKRRILNDALVEIMNSPSADNRKKTRACEIAITAGRPRDGSADITAYLFKKLEVAERFPPLEPAA